MKDGRRYNQLSWLWSRLLFVFPIFLGPLLIRPFSDNSSFAEAALKGYLERSLMFFVFFLSLEVNIVLINQLAKRIEWRLLVSQRRKKLGQVIRKTVKLSRGRRREIVIGNGEGQADDLEIDLQKGEEKTKWREFAVWILVGGLSLLMMVSILWFYRKWTDTLFPTMTLILLITVAPWRELAWRREYLWSWLLISIFYSVGLGVASISVLWGGYGLVPTLLASVFGLWSSLWVAFELSPDSSSSSWLVDVSHSRVRGILLVALATPFLILTLMSLIQLLPWYFRFFHLVGIPLIWMVAQETDVRSFNFSKKIGISAVLSVFGTSILLVLCY